MLGNKLLAKVFGTQNERDLKRLQPLVAEINAREAAVRALHDDELRARTAEFRQRVANGASLEDMILTDSSTNDTKGRRWRLPLL